MTSETEMMKVRKAAFNTMARSRKLAASSESIGPTVPLTEEHIAEIEDGSVHPMLLAELVRRIERRPSGHGFGYAVLTGLAQLGVLDRRREFHERLFSAVWDELRMMHFPASAVSQYRSKVEVISDGRIQEERFGSRWSFKEIHADREALLFSHLYGPTKGFVGGDLVLVDARSYLARTGHGFDDLFHWSVETTPGSKPVVRPAWTQDLIEQAGFILSSPSSDSIIFVNNMPEAGVLHGVGELAMSTDVDFVREYHRCSVKPVVSDAPIVDVEWLSS